MDSPVKPSPQLRFLEEMANHYVFTGDTRTIFLNRFDERNANKENSVLVNFIDWSRKPEDGQQKLQDELKKICQVLEKEGCSIEKSKRGRQPKGRSPWEQAFKWLWQSKFPEWQQSQTINADRSETNSIEERIFRATEQLNHRGFSALVGIQALEEIAKDSSRYHWKIMELLAAFVRNAPPRKEEEGIPDDIQAALTVIGRRDSTKDPQNKKLDLSNTDIRGANLREGKLQGVNLRKANLQGVNFDLANLQGAILKEVNLQGASFYNANLQEEADLRKANLQEVCFLGAKLQGAFLSASNMQGVNLRGAKLKGASLTIANLEGASLDGADLSRANLQGANFMGANLLEVDLAESNLQGTNFRGADLTNAKNIELQQIESAYVDSTTTLPDYLERLRH